MNSKELAAVKRRWRKEVYDRAEEVDPDQEYIWEGLLLGFLLGAGVPLEEARTIAVETPWNKWPI